MVHRHLPKLSDGEFRYLQQMMVEVSGIHMADSKRMLVAGRLMSRLRELDQGDFYEYVNFLRQPANQSERRLVIDLLTTNETYFFREPKHFDFLGEWVASQRGPIHLWSAASSSGEEAYSMAMTWPNTHAPHTGRSLPATSACACWSVPARPSTHWSNPPSSLLAGCNVTACAESATMRAASA